MADPQQPSGRAGLLVMMFFVGSAAIAGAYFLARFLYHHYGS